MLAFDTLRCIVKNIPLVLIHICLVHDEKILLNKRCNGMLLVTVSVAWRDLCNTKDHSRFEQYCAMYLEMPVFVQYGCIAGLG